MQTATDVCEVCQQKAFTLDPDALVAARLAAEERRAARQAHRARAVAAARHAGVVPCVSWGCCAGSRYNDVTFFKSCMLLVAVMGGAPRPGGRPRDEKTTADRRRPRVFLRAQFF